MYAGSERIWTDEALPFYVNKGSAIMFMLGNAKLYNAEFETMNSFTGMYLTDGVSYNYDKTQADEESWLFAGLTNGLFVNVQGMKVEIPGKTFSVPMNSILYMDEENFRFFQNDGEGLSYSELPSTSMAQVTIGGQTFSYEALLQNLGILKSQGASDFSPKTDEEEAETLIPEEGASAPSSDTAQEDTEDISEEEYPLQPAPSEEGRTEESTENGAADQEASDNGGENDSDSSQEGGSSQPGGQDPDQAPDAGEGGGGGSQGGEDAGGANQDGAGDSGETDDSEDSVPGEEVKLPFVVPTASLSDLSTDIYNLSGMLTVEDPSYALKRMTLELYWVPSDEDGNSAGNVSDQSKYQLMYRRTYKAGGAFTIDNLPPNTTIYIRGTLTYYTEGLETKTDVFYDSFENRVTTLPMSTMDPVYVDFDSSASGEYYLQNQIRIHNLRISGPNQNVLKKISKAIVRVTAYDRDGNGSQETAQSSDLAISSLILQRDYFYREEGLEYLSDIKQFSVPANSRIDYEIEFYDLFGNRLTNLVMGYQENQVPEEDKSLKVVGGSGDFEAVGTTYTCRNMPTVDVVTLTSENTQSAIENLSFQLTLNDRHEAVKKDSLLTLMLYRGDAGEDSAPLQTVELKAEELVSPKRVTFDNLTAGQEYQLRIYGTYDLQDNYGEYTNALLSTAEAATISLSSFGRVNYTLSSSHVKTTEQTEETGTVYESATAQKVTAAVNFRTTEAGLFDYDYVDHIQVDMTKTGSEEAVLTGVLEKSRLKQLMIAGTDGAGEAVTAWDLSEVFGKTYTWSYGTEHPEPQVSLTYTDF